MNEIILGVVAFTSIILLLSLFVLGARRLLVPFGETKIVVNERKTIAASIGHRLLYSLSRGGVHLPSACGGAGTCGLCKVTVVRGDDVAGAQELAHLTRREASRGVRLACQVPIIGAMAVEVEEACFDIASWQCRVASARNVTPFIREITLSMPPGEVLDFRAGGFVEVESPPFKVAFKDFTIEAAYRDAWDKIDAWSLVAQSNKPERRAYSLANHPAQNDSILLNVRLALPPPGTKQLQPGLMSSWLCSLSPGDKISVSGCYGHFFVDDSDKEAIFIGGGVGMAPLRSQILDLLETRRSTRKIEFWYGARSIRELYYADLFERLQAEYDNFSWHVVLSEPSADDDWQGATGFVHQMLHDDYLATHAAPEACEYYVCGPPLMVKAVRAMLYELGVEHEDIHYDDFGTG